MLPEGAPLPASRVAEPAGGAEARVLVLTPTGRDAALVCGLLAASGVTAVACADDHGLCREIAGGAGAAVVADEALSPHTVNRLLDVLGSQGPWSDLPLIVFTRRDASDDVLQTLAPLGNATVIERPVRMNTLMTAVQAALRARLRQYEVRDLLRRQAEADRRKDEFLAMLGHELRNPLAAIRNAVSVLDRVGSGEDKEERQRRVIDRQTRHLTRMVDDLLDVSRVTLGKITLKLQPVNLCEVAERCLRELGTVAEAQRRTLDLAVADGPVVVLGDPLRLEQVISNLLHNAVKYTPAGAGISLMVAREGDEAVVRVRDDGIGIAPEMLSRIFEPFTQVESSRSRSQGGLGLGLPLVRNLVELHGGRVSAASAGPGGGSEFMVRLPALEEEAGEAEVAGRAVEKVREPPAAGPPPKRPGLRILVVEDNPDGRESLRDLLEIWGHRVELAVDGSEGLARLLAAPPDVALIDIGLPALDGNEVARRARTGLDGACPCPCLIAMTGYGQPEDRGRALEAGFDTYLVKPVDPDTLARLLADISLKRGRAA